MKKISKYRKFEIIKGFKTLRIHFIIIVWGFKIHKLVLDNVIIHLEDGNLGREFI